MITASTFMSGSPIDYPTLRTALLEDLQTRAPRHEGGVSSVVKETSQLDDAVTTGSEPTVVTRGPRKKGSAYNPSDRKSRKTGLPVKKSSRIPGDVPTFDDSPTRILPALVTAPPGRPGPLRSCPPPPRRRVKLLSSKWSRPGAQ